MLFDFEGQTVHPVADLVSLTDASNGYIGSLNHRAAPVQAVTVAGLLASFDTMRENAWKFVGSEERAAAHPALARYMALNFVDANAARAETLAALAADGYDAARPLSDADERALLGSGLWRVRTRLFPGRERPFYDAEAIEAIRAAYVADRARLDVEAERNRKAAEARKSRGPSQAERFNPLHA